MRPRISIIVNALLACQFGVACVMPAHADTNPNAYADLDWVNRSQFGALQDPRLADIPAYCQGAFLEPDVKSDELTPANGSEQSQVTAFSNEVTHIPGVSTEFLGNVALRYEGLRLYSDSIIYRIDQNNITLPDSILLREPGFLLRGDHAYLDLDTGEVDFWNTTYVMHAQHAHGRAKQIRRKGDTTLIREGTYTSCPPSEHPIWQLRTHKMKLDATTGWGTAQHARVEVYNVPVLYLPYIQFPIDDRRKTGLLFPSISSSAGGMDVSVPLYLNLAPNYDATLSPRYINGRGTLFQNELRYLNQAGHNTLSVSALNNDAKIIQAQQAAKAQNTTLDSVDPDRLFASLRHAGQYSPKISSLINADYVSDEEYFHDFGNDFQTSTQTYLDRSASLIYSDTYWQLSTGVKGFQTIDDDIPLADRPYSQLPMVALSGHYPLSKHVDLLLQSENAYFTRETHDPVLANPEGNRLRVEPGVQATFSSPWGHISPTIKVKQLSYWLESEHGASTIHPERSEDVTVPLFSLDSGLFFERDLEWGKKDYRQTLDPRIFYLYSPKKNQQNLPNFDSSELTFNYSQLFRDSRFSGGDRIADYNQVSIGLGSNISSQDSGNELLSLSLGQAFFIEDPAIRLLPNQDSPESSPISGSMTMHLSQNWLINSGFTWNSDKNINETNSLGVTYLGDTGQLLGLELYSREIPNNTSNAYDQSQQSKLAFVWPLHPQWKILGYWHYNLKDQTNLEGDLSIENLIGVQYENCCVEIKLLNHRYLQEQFNEVKPTRQLRLQLQLKGMANLDDQVTQILQRTIPYYQ